MAVMNPIPADYDIAHPLNEATNKIRSLWQRTHDALNARHFNLQADIDNLQKAQWAEAKRIASLEETLKRLAMAMTEEAYILTKACPKTAEVLGQIIAPYLEEEEKPG